MWKAFLLALMMFASPLLAEPLTWKTSSIENPESKQKREILYLEIKKGYYISVFNPFYYFISSNKRGGFDQGEYYDVSISFNGEEEVYPFLSNDTGTTLLPLFRDPDFYNVFLSRQFNPDAYQKALEEHMSRMKEEFSSKENLEIKIIKSINEELVLKFSGSTDLKSFNDYFNPR